MLRQIIGKEIRESFLNKRLMALAVFSMVLMPLSSYISTNYYEARRSSFDSQYAEFNNSERQVWDQRAYRPPELMSILALGAEPYMPRYYKYEGNVQDFFPGNTESQEFTALSSLGTFDALFLIQIIFSLLAILLAFDMVAGEKEAGTLKAIMANPVPRDNVIIGKFIGGFAVLWLVFSIGFLLLYLVLVVSDGRFTESENALRVAFIYGTSVLYLAGFFSLGVMVSTLCHTSRAAIISLLIVWVVLQLVIPKASQMIATAFVEVRSENQVSTERAQMVRENGIQVAERAADLYLRLSGETDIQLASPKMRENPPWADDFRNQYQELYRTSQQKQGNQLRALRASWDRQKQRQQNTAKAIGLLSPATAIMLLITDTAGSGDMAIERYKEEIDRHLLTVDREISVKTSTNTFVLQKGSMRRMGRFAGAENPDAENIPQFSVSKPSISLVIARHVWAIVTLVVYIIVPLLVGYVRFLVYDVR